MLRIKGFLGPNISCECSKLSPQYGWKHNDYDSVSLSVHIDCGLLLDHGYTKTKTKPHNLSPRANYTDRATAACRRSDCQTLRIEDATLSE
jgi:hypothetical protein